MPARRLLITALLLLAPCRVDAQTSGPAAAPAVHLLATGGTISNLGGEGRLTGEALVRALPGVERVANATVEQFSNVASGAITLEQWVRLARRIEELYRTRPELAGVVVTHGTDTMEETAYFLHLTVGDCRPVVVTGAMRPANAIGADGPANLHNAIRLAVAPAARRLGAVVLMNDYVFPAREVTKTNTSRLETFAAPDVGPLGVTDPDSVVLFGEPARARCGRPAFDLSGLDSLPRVEVIPSYLGADGALIRAAVAAGARGIVLAGVGRGGSTPAQGEALREAAARGVAVVISSRTGAGRVPVNGRDDDAWIGAGDLNPHKARVLLMLALTRTRDPRQIREIFLRH